MQKIELEWVTGPDELSLRELARRHEASFSYIAKRARDDGWEQKRQAFRDREMSKAVTALTDTLAVKVAKVKGDALEVIHAAILKMGLDLRDRVLSDGTVVPGQVITPSDVSKLIASFQTLTGQASAITENRNLGITLNDDLPPEVARLLADIAGERGTNTRPVGRAALPGARSAGQN